jgi:hypothetical protein
MTARPILLGEIYALRRPQLPASLLDPKNGAMFMSDIGQDNRGENQRRYFRSQPVDGTRGKAASNSWDGKTNPRGNDGPRADAKVTYPIVEFGQLDPLLQSNSARDRRNGFYRSTRISSTF